MQSSVGVPDSAPSESGDPNDSGPVLTEAPQPHLPMLATGISADTACAPFAAARSNPEFATATDGLRASTSNL